MSDDLILSFPDFRFKLITYLFLAVVLGFLVFSCSNDPEREYEDMEPNVRIIYPADGFTTSGDSKFRVEIITSDVVDSTNYSLEGLLDTTFAGRKEILQFDFSDKEIHPDSAYYNLTVTVWSNNLVLSDISQFMVIREILTKVTSLTVSEIFNIAPVWSILTSEIVIQTGRTGNMEIFSISISNDVENPMGGDAGTQSATNLSNNPEPDLTPAIWRTGKRIAYVADRDSSYDIWSFGLSAPDTVRITEDDAVELFPAWSSDGSLIAYERQGEENADIWVVETATNTSKALIEEEGWDGHPSFSPDGASIVFHSNRDGDYDLWTSPVDGGTQERLLEWNSDEKNPVWSPDAKYIAFTSDRAGNKDIWVYRIDDGSVFQITNHPADDDFPAFSPSNSKLAFASVRSDNWDVSILDISALP